MKRFAGIAVLLAASALMPAPAQTAEGPWCRILNLGSDASDDCQYMSLEECQPLVIAGQRGFCNPNPRWQGPDQTKTGRKRTSRRY